jgi:hypothetical protein
MVILGGVRRKKKNTKGRKRDENPNLHGMFVTN